MQPRGRQRIVNKSRARPCVRSCVIIQHLKCNKKFKKDASQFCAVLLNVVARQRESRIVTDYDSDVVDYDSDVVAVQEDSYKQPATVG